MSDTDIIVTGRPFAVFQQTDFYPPMTNVAIAGQLVANDMAPKQVVTVDPEAQSDEIVVVGQKLKLEVTKFAVQAAIFGAQVDAFTVPCIGVIGHSEVAGIAKNMKFNISNRDFGPGRAGENLAGSNGTAVPVNVNGAQMVAYNNLTNGITYIVAHEIAHSLRKMQEYDHAMWNQYLANVDPSWTEEQKRSAYYLSPQYAANEARANTVARALAQKYGLGVMTPDPTHGYQVC